MSFSSDFKNPPRAFLCTGSEQIMTEPVLASCGHLFERAKLNPSRVCPIDNTSIDMSRLIPFAELKETIKRWKESSAAVAIQQQVRPVGQSYASMARASRPPLPEQSVAVKSPAFQEFNPVKKIKNAHYDDVHGLINLGPDSFVSGSKDGTVKVWDHEGTTLQARRLNDRVGYKYWVTSLSDLGDGLWASGTRDGWIDVWNKKDGGHFASFQYQTHKEKNCKERNFSRINCITPHRTFNGKKAIYTGTPGYVQLWEVQENDLVQNRFLRGYKAHNYDWVYCVEVLENKDLLVVVGPNLEYWDMRGFDPEKTRLIQEQPLQSDVPRNKQFIPAITRLENNRNIVASVQFDGSLKLLDIKTGQLKQTYKEHLGRAWSVINLSDDLLATGADDATIKIWDLRQSKSAFSIEGQGGRVSSLLSLTDSNLFVSAACPDKVYESAEKACISFWDMRKLQEAI